MNGMLVLDGNGGGVVGSMVENIGVSLDMANLDAADVEAILEELLQIETGDGRILATGSN